MIKVENIDVFNFEGALRGMRNPLQSHSKSDSAYGCDVETSCANCGFKPDWCGNATHYVIGKNDLELMQKLYKAGTEHRKYLRQIFVSMDITCNHTFWAEFDTYKVGVTRNSCSKMHRIHAKEFMESDFSHEGISEVGYHTEECFKVVVKELEHLRIMYNNSHDKKFWRALIELLPMGYNLKATVTMNYENVVTIIKQRTGHRLTEWNTFVEILKDLPYVKEIIGEQP